METSKSFNQEYIEKAKKLIHEILEDKKEYDDWTQICFSMQNAVQAAANIWGASSDEQIYKMKGFVTEVHNSTCSSQMPHQQSSSSTESL